MYLELSTLTVDIEHRLGIDRKDHLPPVVFFTQTLQLYTRWDSGINGKKSITVNFINQSLAKYLECKIPTTVLSVPVHVQHYW